MCEMHCMQQAEYQRRSMLVVQLLLGNEPQTTPLTSLSSSVAALSKSCMRAYVTAAASRDCTAASHSRQHTQQAAYNYQLCCGGSAV